MIGVPIEAIGASEKATDSKDKVVGMPVEPIGASKQAKVEDFQAYKEPEGNCFQ